MSILSRITTENYLKTIVNFLAIPNNEFITTGELANLMSVTPGTATSMLKQLEKKDYIKYKSHHGAVLTQKGAEFGISIIRRHRLLETFLEQVLKMEKDEVHAEAENLEHAVSDNLIDLIDQYLGFPNKDPHGKKIPSKAQKKYHLEGVRLSSVEKNKIMQVEAFSKTPKLKTYFEKIKLNCGSEITVIEKNIDIGLATLLVDQKEIICSTLILDKIIVK